ncbi:hypothetical protein FRC01_014535 [Tulasnella sp. 417]|nr:hypothetical protein FRC01_014535 [Tulasnella sp. 417]
MFRLRKRDFEAICGGQSQYEQGETASHTGCIGHLTAFPQYWNVKVAVLPTRRLQKPSEPAAYIQQEAEYDAVTLKEAQSNLEARVYRIWTQLSAFEETATACISHTLQHVNDGMYVDAIRAAEKFVPHFEVLFAVIDEIEVGFTAAAAGEARMLRSKIVEVFNVLSRSKVPPARSSTAQVPHQARGMDQELVILVTSLSHYKRVLIVKALRGALTLEREHANKEALPKFLDRFQSLKIDCTGPSALEWFPFALTCANLAGASSESAANVIKIPGSTSVSHSRGILYGYWSLRPENTGEAPSMSNAITQGAQKDSWSVLVPPSVACVACQSTIDEDCVRLGTYQRWHSHCIKCATRGKAAAVPPSTAGPAIDRPQRATVNLDDFRCELLQAEASSSTEQTSGQEIVVYCTPHATLGCRGGFIPVSRLEHYAFLLYVGVQRLGYVLQRRNDAHLIASSTTSPGAPDLTSKSYRYSHRIFKTKAWASLDGKLSAIVHRPWKSTIIEVLTGKMAQPTRS